MHLPREALAALLFFLSTTIQTDTTYFRDDSVRVDWQVRVLNGYHEGLPVWDVAWSADSVFLVSCGADRSLVVSRVLVCLSAGCYC